MNRCWIIGLGGWLLAVAVQAAGPAELAAELFAEGRWQECTRECQRAELVEPASTASQVLEAVAQLRLGRRDAATLGKLAALAAASTTALATDLRALAAFELGRVNWQQGDLTNAYRRCRAAFQGAVSPELFARSSRLLAELLRSEPGLGKEDPVLVQTVETCRPLWTPEVVGEVLGTPAQGAFAVEAKPVQWIVTLYRANIRPALGARCSLTPSCSEYFLQAGKKHGVLAFPMAADRLVREPSVVQAAEQPVPTGDAVRYADPVAQHDFWMKK